MSVSDEDWDAANRRIAELCAEVERLREYEWLVKQDDVRKAADEVIKRWTREHEAVQAEAERLKKGGEDFRRRTVEALKEAYEAHAEAERWRDTALEQSASVDRVCEDRERALAEVERLRETLREVASYRIGDVLTPSDIAREALGEDP